MNKDTITFIVFIVFVFLAGAFTILQIILSCKHANREIEEYDIRIKQNTEFLTYMKEQTKRMEERNIRLRKQNEELKDILKRLNKECLNGR